METEIELTWKAQVPRLVEIIRWGSDEGRTFAVGELTKLAAIVDEDIAVLKRLREQQQVPCPDCGIRGSHTLGCPLGLPDDDA